jgi:phage-related protein|tara:strand:- start:18 stop:587 length:570 start_codon:yes stop_codon:yes gene_type:complete
MATFPSFTPTYTSFNKQSNPVKRLIRFADGYEHRVLFGLASHQSPKTYNLEFNESEEDADVIEAFLESRENDQASFDFTPHGEGISKTGTYSQSGTTITVTITKHGIAIGKTVTLDFTSGSATDGTFIVASSASVDTFTVTAAASATNSGNVTATVSGSRKFVCEGYTKTIPYNNRAKIKTQFREVFEP